MVAPDGRARRAHSDMLEISPIWALVFAKDSMAAQDGRARKAHSNMLEISSILAWTFVKASFCERFIILDDGIAIRHVHEEWVHKEGEATWAPPHWGGRPRVPRAWTPPTLTISAVHIVQGVGCVGIVLEKAILHAKGKGQSVQHLFHDIRWKSKVKCRFQVRRG